jgi:hypothetical protein
MGPFIVELDGNGTSLVPRPFRWNRIVNMLCAAPDPFLCAGASHCSLEPSSFGVSI